jgi:hypothetical protein
VINEGETKYMKISSNVTHLEQDLVTELRVFEGNLIDSKLVISYQMKSRFAAGN